MKRKTVSGMMLTVILISMLTLAFNISQVEAEPRTWTVDDDGPADFSSIQQAINSPLVAAGDTIFVYSGTYYENVVINKTVSLIGENKDTTIVDGGKLYSPNVIKVIENNIVFGSFTVKGGGFFRVLILLNETANTVIAGNNLIGEGSYVNGIEVYSSTNITLTGNKLETGYNGIRLFKSFNNTVTGNILTQVGGLAIALYSSVNNRIAGNNITGKEYPLPPGLLGTGILLSAYWGENGSSYNTFYDNHIRNCGTAIFPYPAGGGAGPHHNNVFLRNTIEDNGVGLYMYHSFNFTFKDNKFSRNLGYNIGVYGSSLSEYIHKIDTSNTVNGKPVYYLINQKNLRINPVAFPDIGYLALINSTNITVENLNLKENWQGLLMACTQNSTILNNDITNNHIGIYMDILTSNNTISKNNIVGQTLVVGQTWAGILSQYSFNNSLTRNTVSNNKIGIYLKTSFNNTLAFNTIVNNSRGGVWLDYSFNNILVSNDIKNNSAQAVSDAGVSLYQSYVNKIFHNNFINNQRQAYTCLGNIWDDGYPSGGNYWSDYSTRYPSVADEYKGENQDIPGSDGIWDRPYIIGAYNQDNYPLTEPWSPVISATLDIDPDTLNLRSRGRWITAYIELPEDYNVSDIDVYTVMLNDTIPISLLDVPAPEPVPTEIGDYDEDGIPDLMVKFDRASVELFIYNQGIRYDNIALTITGELFDGTPFEGTDIIFVNYAGDVNNDETIDILDIGTVSAHWYPGPPTGPLGYDSNADFNHDGTVNVLDAGILSVNWGQTVP